MSPDPAPPFEQTTPDDTMPEPMPPPVDDTMTPPPTDDTLPPDTMMPPPVDTPTDPENPDAPTDPTVPPAGCPTSLSRLSSLPASLWEGGFFLRSFRAGSPGCHAGIRLGREVAPWCAPTGSGRREADVSRLSCR